MGPDSEVSLAAAGLMLLRRRLHPERYVEEAAVQKKVF